MTQKVLVTIFLITTLSKSPPSLVSPASSSDLEQFDALSRRRDQDPFDLSALEGPLSPSPATNGMSSGATKKSPSAFLGENSSLVNLERLLQPAPAPAAPNPFAEPPRPFLPPQPAKLSINELKQQQMGLSGLAFPSAGAPPAPAPADPWAPAPAPRGASPWSPQNHRHTPNPFLS